MGLNTDEHEMVYVLKKLELYMAFGQAMDPILIQRLNDELQKLKKKRSDGSSEYLDIVNNLTQHHHIDIR